MNNSTTQNSPTSSQSRETLLGELENTRTAFHALLSQVNETDWNRPALSVRWTLGEVICHITSYLDVVIPLGLNNALRGKNMPKMPGFIVNRINYMMAHSYTRKQSHSSIAATYDKAHARALELLAGVHEDEWGLTTQLPIGKLSVGEIFQHHIDHFQLHREDVLYGLNRQK